MNDLKEYLPFIIPAALIELGLMAAALTHILTHKTYRTGNQLLWILVSVLINTIGPVLYFVIGRSDEGKGDES